MIIIGQIQEINISTVYSFPFFLLLKEAVFDVSQILRKILINYYLILLSNKMISYKLSFLAKKKKLRILVPK